MTARTRARRGEGERLAEEILEAATRLLIETGDENAVTIRSVATAVGVTPPAIYLHYADKNELLVAVCRRTFEDLDEFIERAAEGIDDPIESLRVRGAAYVRFGLENPEHYRILFMTRMAHHHEEPQELLGVAAFDHHLASVQRCVDAGLLRPDVDTVMAAVGLWTAVHGVTSLLIAHPQFPWPPVDDLVEHVLEVHGSGLRATAP